MQKKEGFAHSESWTLNITYISVFRCYMLKLQEAVVLIEAYRPLDRCACSLRRPERERGRRLFLARTFPAVPSWTVVALRALVWCGLWNSIRLQKHHRGGQACGPVCVSVCGRTGSDGTGSAVAGGERKQEAEVNCWESEISTLNAAWQWYTKQPVCTARLWRGERLWPCQISQ